MINWTVHPIEESGEKGTLYALLPNDGTTGLLIGERHEVQAAAAALHQFLDTGDCGDAIPSVHPQLGARWLTVREASTVWGVPRATITWALRRGLIRYAEKLGNRWRFPQRTFLSWLAHR